MKRTNLEKEVQKLIGQRAAHTPDLVILQGQVTQLITKPQNKIYFASVAPTRQACGGKTALKLVFKPRMRRNPSTGKLGEKVDFLKTASPSHLGGVVHLQNVLDDV